jgi:hypothetical protein
MPKKANATLIGKIRQFQDLTRGFMIISRLKKTSTEVEVFLGYLISKLRNVNKVNTYIYTAR